jgi:hypothetical protein
MTAIQQLLYQEIQTLPDDSAAEVLDFVQFLKSGSTEEAFLWSQVEKHIVTAGNTLKIS